MKSLNDLKLDGVIKFSSGFSRSFSGLEKLVTGWNEIFLVKAEMIPSGLKIIAKTEQGEVTSYIRSENEELLSEIEKTLNTMNGKSISETYGAKLFDWPTKKLGE